MSPEKIKYLLKTFVDNSTAAFEAVRQLKKHESYIEDNRETLKANPEIKKLFEQMDAIEKKMNEL